MRYFRLQNPGGSAGVFLFTGKNLLPPPPRFFNVEEVPEGWRWGRVGKSRLRFPQFRLFHQHLQHLRQIVAAFEDEAGLGDD
jgi:hypothetical protein